jgi:hypothetical protein
MSHGVFAFCGSLAQDWLLRLEKKLPILDEGVAWGAEEQPRRRHSQRAHSPRRLCQGRSERVVGASLDFATQFVATIWKRGVATSLDTLIPADSLLHLLSACSIDSGGEMIGLARDAEATSTWL